MIISLKSKTLFHVSLKKSHLKSRRDSGTVKHEGRNNRTKKAILFVFVYSLSNPTLCSGVFMEPQGKFGLLY